MNTIRRDVTLEELRRLNPEVNYVDLPPCDHSNKNGSHCVLQRGHVGYCEFYGTSPSQPRYVGGLTFTTTEAARDPLDEATVDMQCAIAAFHDVIRAAKREGSEARRTEIYYRSVNLLGFVQAMALDARRDLDALKDLPL